MIAWARRRDAESPRTGSGGATRPTIMVHVDGLFTFPPYD